MIHLVLAVIVTLIGVVLYRVWPKSRLGPFPASASGRAGYIMRVIHRVLATMFFAGLLAGVAMLIQRGARDLIGM
jgi:hypothetical protein